MQKRLPFLITALLLLLAPQAGASTAIVEDKLRVEVTVSVKHTVFLSLYELIPVLWRTPRTNLFSSGKI